MMWWDFLVSSKMENIVGEIGIVIKQGWVHTMLNLWYMVMIARIWWQKGKQNNIKDWSYANLK